MATPLEARAGRALDALAGGLEALRDRAAAGRPLRLAVTGLRRSGKTVLVTALARHLLDGAGLPALGAVEEGRYLGARALPAAGPGEARFPAEAFEAGLAAAGPRWPEPTRTLSTLRLKVRFRTRHPALARVRPIGELPLEIVDYPGEWLLDLPLLEQGYDAFAAGAWRRAGRPPRSAIASEWVELARVAPQLEPADGARVGRLADAFARYLRRAQSELGLPLVEPGRLADPGPHAGSDALRFAPLPPLEGGGEAPPGSLRAVMAERYGRYRDGIVRAFYLEHFRRFDRQVVLVDLLHALNAGPEHFAETREALAAILRSFRYGEGSRLGRLLGRPRIDRLLFAASQADHVAPAQHAALAALLRALVRPAARTAEFEGLRPEAMALAAVRCTEVVQAPHEGQTLSLLRGRLLDEGGREAVIYPGEVPPEPPEPEDWPEDRFRFRRFAPRRLRGPAAAGEHIGLDRALDYLIGDRLR